MSWELAKSRRGVKPGDRVMIYWPRDALETERSEQNWRMAYVQEGMKFNTGEAGGVYDLPPAGFRIWRQDGEQKDAKKQEYKFTLKQIEAAGEAVLGKNSARIREMLAILAKEGA